jgi:hypothetical protein
MNQSTSQGQNSEMTIAAEIASSHKSASMEIFELCSAILLVEGPRFLNGLG